MYLPKGSIMAWAGNDVTEHNRGPIDVEFKRIESSKRMAGGTLRKYVIADKKEFSTSWKMLPDANAGVIDKKWAGNAMEAFYKSNPGEFTLSIKDGVNGAVTNYQVVFTNFSKVINKRGKYDVWDVDITLEEV